MLLRRAISVSSSLRFVLSYHSRRTLLSQKFALDEEWLRRNDDLNALGIAGSYEWITAVQKKFVSAGIASAVDVDAAVSVASEEDQVDDVIRIVYKLRHTVNAGDMLPSTDYALLRLLLNYNKDDILLAIISDPINYGIFANEHSACLMIDHFLRIDKVADALRVTCAVMLQEMFQSNLLNLLCVFCALKWVELPTENRVFNELPNLMDEGSNSSPSNVMHEDDERMFKFPYLKNRYLDSHFDLSDHNQLVGKCLLWFIKNLSVEQELTKNILLIGHLYFGEFKNAKQILATFEPFTFTIECCISRIEQLLANQQQEAGEEGAEVLELKELLEKCNRKDSMSKLSDVIKNIIMTVKDVEEERLKKLQVETFQAWKKRRAELVQAQAERLELTLRLTDVQEKKKQLYEKWEMLNFFEHRLRWEEIAHTKNELLKREKGKSKSREELEQEYMEQMFLKRNTMDQKG